MKRNAYQSTICLLYISAAMLVLLLSACTRLGAGHMPAPAERSTAIPNRTPAHIPAPTPSSAPLPAPTPIPLPAPAPTPAEGDFSSVFPKESTGEKAYKSYQSDDVRIAIVRVQKKGVLYYVADIWIRDIRLFRTAFAKGKYGGGRQSMKTLAKNNKALLALSGDYYGARENGIVIRNGKLYRDRSHYDVCVLYQNGEMHTYLNKEWEAIRDTAQGVYQAWGFGPKLLDEFGQTTTYFDGFDKERLNPRAAIGYYEPGHYCFVVVEGRCESSKGMLLSDLSRLFYELGCKTAYNLDGGATAILAFKGEYINAPSNGGRAQYDILYIGEPKKQE